MKMQSSGTADALTIVLLLNCGCHQFLSFQGIHWQAIFTLEKRIVPWMFVTNSVRPQETDCSQRRRVLSILESQSSPSNRPSPLIADVLKMAQSLLLISDNPKPSATAASSRACGRSCCKCYSLAHLRSPKTLCKDKIGKEVQYRACFKYMRWLRQLLCLPSIIFRVLELRENGVCYLLVCINQYKGILELFLRQNGMKLSSWGAYAFCVAAVYHINDCLCVRVVAPPVGPYAGLASQVPYLELDVLIGDSLHIEANGYKSKQNFGHCWDLDE